VSEWSTNLCAAIPDGATEFAGVENARGKMQEKIARIETTGVRSMEWRNVLKA